MEMMYEGRVPVDAGLLAQALRLPPDAKIVGATWDGHPGHVILSIQHPDMPPYKWVPRPVDMMLTLNDKNECEFAGFYLDGKKLPLAEGE